MKVLATLSAALLSAVLVVPGGEWGGGCDGSGYADFQHRVTQRRWLHKNLRETDVRMRLGEPDCVESYGLLSFWRYPGARTIIFDASGQVIGWQNF